MNLNAELRGLAGYLKKCAPSILKFSLNRALPAPKKIHTSGGRASNFLVCRLLTPKYSSVPRYVPTQRARARLVVQRHHAKRAGIHRDIRITMPGSNRSISFATKAEIDGFRKTTWVRTPDHDSNFSDIPDGYKIEAGYGQGYYEKELDAPIDIIESGPHKINFWLGADKYSIRLDNDNKWFAIRQPAEDLQLDLVKHRYKTGFEVKPGAIVSRKVDGSHEIIRISGKTARLYSHRQSLKNGYQIEHTAKLPQLRDLVNPFSKTELHGELYHPDGANKLASLLNSSPANAREGGSEDCRLALFDIKTWKGKDISDLPYSMRRVYLQKVINQAGNKNWEIVDTPAQGESIEEFNQRVLSDKIPTDGIVAADPDAAYQQDTWIRVKPIVTDDCPVIRINEGGGRLAGSMGSLTVKTPTGSVNVGTGFSDTERQEIWADKESYLSRVAEVSFHDRCDSKQTGPRFERWHPEK